MRLLSNLNRYCCNVASRLRNYDFCFLLLSNGCLSNCQTKPPCKDPWSLSGHTWIEFRFEDPSGPCIHSTDRIDVGFQKFYAVKTVIMLADRVIKCQSLFHNYNGKMGVKIMTAFWLITFPVGFLLNMSMPSFSCAKILCLWCGPDSLKFISMIRSNCVTA